MSPVKATNICLPYGEQLAFTRGWLNHNSVAGTGASLTLNNNNPIKGYAFLPFFIDSLLSGGRSLVPE